jgi:nucleoside-diphosphate-sugar epimerase
LERVLITGASGFVGGHVVRALRSNGLSVRCLVRATSRLEYIKSFEPELAWGDVSDPGTLGPALQNVDAVVHCAGLTRASSRDEYFRVNEGGSDNLLSACLPHKNHLERFVHISSLAAFGPAVGGRPLTEEAPPHPVSQYGESKLAAQRRAEAHMADLPICILVPPAVYGPNDADFCAYFKMVARGFMPAIGSRVRHLSLLYAEDLASAVIAALRHPGAPGRSFFVEDGTAQTWESIGMAIGRAMGRRPRTLRIPAALVKCIGLLGDAGTRLSGKTRLLTSQKLGEILQDAWTCSSARIRAELGYQPQHSLERGIGETLQWYRSHRWI